MIDALVEGHSDDPVMDKLINLVIRSINRKESVFPDMMSEPLQYPIFVGWVKAGLEERAKIDQVHKKVDYVGDASR